MLAALAVLVICSSVLVAAFGQSARALQQVQRSDRMSLVARSVLDDASAGRLQPGRSEGRWSDVQWHLDISALPASEGPARAWRLDLSLSDGTRNARYSTLQVRSVGTGAGQ